MRRSLLLGGLSWALPGGSRPARAQPALAPALADYAAGMLARLIEAARERAIADGVKPIPPGIQRALIGYFPDDLLRRARYASGRGKGTISLPSLAFTYGDTAAMTLGEVILFRDERAAQTDTKLWAHELTHMMQYQRWGIEGFAREYVADRARVEKEAVDNAARFAAWRAGKST